MTTLNPEFFSHFFINIIFVAILSYGCYFRVSKNNKIAASFLLFGVGIFVITNLLHSVDISMGFAFGLFALFTMLRYRTEPITIKEMTYLFLVIAIALLSAVSSASIFELTLINALLCLVAFIADSSVLQGKYLEQSIKYEKIDNIKPKNYHLLEADLGLRTGLNIIDIEVEEIDFLRDTALLKVRYLPPTEKERIEMSVLSQERACVMNQIKRSIYPFFVALSACGNLHADEANSHSFPVMSCWTMISMTAFF